MLINAGHAGPIANENEAAAPTLEPLHAALYRYCLSLTGSRWDAEDLVQDTWLKALGKLRGNGHPNAEAFLLRTAKNTWIDQLRRKRLLSRLQLEIPPGAADPSETLLELEHAFASIVKHLTPLQSAVFLLRDLLEFSSAETAKRLRMTEGAAKALLHRARRALDGVRRELRGDHPSEPLDDGLKLFARALAAAYLRGDMAVLAELVQRDLVPPAAAIGLLQSRALLKRPAPAKPLPRPTAQMAA